MKKLFAIIAVLLLSAGLVFARGNDDDYDYDDRYHSMKVGIGGSYLGPEVTFGGYNNSFDYNFSLGTPYIIPGLGETLSLWDMFTKVEVGCRTDESLLGAVGIGAFLMDAFYLQSFSSINLFGIYAKYEKSLFNKMEIGVKTYLPLFVNMVGDGYDPFEIKCFLMDDQVFWLATTVGIIASTVYCRWYL